jgi:hypothetical protein
MIAYHFSDKLFDTLKPQFPQHSYTTKYSIPISYLYIYKKGKEYFVPDKYLYVFNIPKKYLISINKIKKWNFSIVEDYIEKAIELGYKGIIDRESNRIYYFFPLKPIKIIKLYE